MRGWNWLRRQLRRETHGGDPPIRPVTIGDLVGGHDGYNVVDEAPWEHPFLTRENLTRFRDYSDCVWDHVDRVVERTGDRRGRWAFVNNLAQNLYNWGRQLSRYGDDVNLVADPQDQFTISQPEWEEFDGEWSDLADGHGFLESHACETEIDVVRPGISDCGLNAALTDFAYGNRSRYLHLLHESPGVRYLELEAFQQCTPLTEFARTLSRYEALCAQCTPLAAYFSGRPYCTLYVGGDLQYDCGRGDWYGRLMHLAFAASRFLFVGGPDGIAYSRRLDLRNAIYFPTPIDVRKYSPGDGQARSDWRERTGKDVFVLTTARIDDDVKGNGSDLLSTLESVAQRHPNVAFVFLKWGNHHSRLAERIAGSPERNSFLLLPPVGKKRLVDYYRSADVVLDQFVFGYYGMTGFETAAVGRPIVINLRREHYEPLYRGDLMPVNHATSGREVVAQLDRLIESETHRREQGRLMREWSLRNHNDDDCVERLHRMLLFTAMNESLPRFEVEHPFVRERDAAEHPHHGRWRTAA